MDHQENHFIVDNNSSIADNHSRLMPNQADYETSNVITNNMNNS